MAPLSGVRLRSYEYPASEKVFSKLGHMNPQLLARTQSTKIGRETHFIQHDYRGKPWELVCTLNHLDFNLCFSEWPVTNREKLTARELHRYNFPLLDCG